MLLNFNNLSSVRMQQMHERFLHHTKTLVEMKKDLDSIFRRIRWATGTLLLLLLVGRQAVERLLRLIKVWVGPGGVKVGHE